MGFGKELSDNITGNVEHAVIIIEDKRMNSAANPALNNSSSVSPSNYMIEMGKQEADVSALNQGSKKKFYVQFNPSTLSLSADRRKKDPKKDVSDNKMSTNDDMMEFPRNTMSVKLIFDQVNNCDAFMNEMLVLNPTSITAQVVNTVKKKEFTVLPYVEGFIAAIRNPYTRGLTFQWGNFTFSGNLESVNAAYTMFSVSGQPVRAEITLSVVANRADKETVGYKNPLNAEPKEKNKSIQKVGNLFNLP